MTLRNDSSTQNVVSTQKMERPPRSLAEWVTFTISSLIVGGIAGLVIYAWATDGDRPPVLVVKQTEAIREENGQFYIPFEISNTGGETAESVQVIAELEKQDKVEQVGDLQVDFLASGEQEKGAFVFAQDPRQGKLVLRVGSYKVP